MSKFTSYLIQEFEAMAEPGNSNNATSGNVSNKHPVLKHTPTTNEKDTDDKFKKLIDDNNISIDQNSVETIISLVNKNLNDWNREKNLNGSEIVKIVNKAIELELIDIN